MLYFLFSFCMAFHGLWGIDTTNLLAIAHDCGLFVNNRGQLNERFSNLDYISFINLLKDNESLYQLSKPLKKPFDGPYTREAVKNYYKPVLLAYQEYLLQSNLPLEDKLYSILKSNYLSYKKMKERAADVLLSNKKDADRLIKQISDMPICIRKKGYKQHYHGDGQHKKLQSIYKLIKKSINKERNTQNAFLGQMPNDIQHIIIKSIIENDSSDMGFENGKFYIKNVRSVCAPTDLTESYNKVFLCSTYGQIRVYVFDKFYGDIAQIRNLKSLMLTNKHFYKMVSAMMHADDFAGYFVKTMYQNLTHAFSPRCIINPSYEIYFAALLHNEAGQAWIYNHVEQYNSKLLEIPGHFNMVVAPVATYHRFESKKFQEFKAHIKAFNI